MYTYRMDEQEISARFAAVETKLAFLEDFMARLQEEVVARGGALDRVLTEQAAVKEKVMQLAAELEEVPDRRPPHY